MSKAIVNLREESDRKSFVGWFIIEALSKTKDVATLIPDTTSVRVTLNINGREFDAKPVLQRASIRMDKLIEERLRGGNR